MRDTFKSSITKFKSFVNVPLEIYAGSCKTQVYSGGKLLFNQRTCLALHKSTKDVLAFGNDAWEWYEKNPENIDVVFPVAKGEISDLLFFKLFMKSVLQAVNLSQKNYTNFFSQNRAKFFLPWGISPAKKKLTKESLLQTGFSFVDFDFELQEQAKRINKAHFCIVNIGCQQTQVGLFSKGTLTAAKKIAFGGNGYTDIVKTVVREELQSEIGSKAAENLKIDIAVVPHSKERKQVKKTILGRSVVENTSQSIIVSSDIFNTRFVVYTDELISSLKDFFSFVSASLVTDAISGGVFLTGGGGQLRGMGEYLSEEFKSEVVVI